MWVLVRTQSPKARTAQDWHAKEFPVWDSVTELFKELRRVEEHEMPLLIQVRERQYVGVFGAVIAFEGTWDLDDPLAESPPERLVAVEADPETGLRTDRIIEPLRREFDFVLSPRSEKTKALLQAGGTSDVHALAQRCYQTLKAYFEFYQERLAKAGQAHN